MRLIDLSPRLLDERGVWEPRSYHEIAFLCPKCLKTEIHVGFHAGRAADVEVGKDSDEKPIIKRLWHREGVNGFEDLSLTPSINRTPCRRGCEGWHGFITNGEIT